MCNIYHIRPRKNTTDTFQEKVSEAAASLPSPLIRKTTTGLVVRSGGQISNMRWGFFRDFNPSINNTRVEKIESGMWAEALRLRRCVIPVTTFYEWGSLPDGKKQAHAFQATDDNWLWLAGIWEENSEHGLCYSMVTTSAGPAMTDIHDRMPAVLSREDANAWLKGTFIPSVPYSGPIAVSTCSSPLKESGEPPSEDQPELF